MCIYTPCHEGGAGVEGGRVWMGWGWRQFKTKLKALKIPKKSHSSSPSARVWARVQLWFMVQVNNCFHTPHNTQPLGGRETERERYEQPQPAVNDGNMKNQKQVLNFFTAPEIFIVDMKRSWNRLEGISRVSRWRILSPVLVQGSGNCLRWDLISKYPRGEWVRQRYRFSLGNFTIFCIVNNWISDMPFRCQTMLVKNVGTNKFAICRVYSLVLAIH